MPSLSGSSNIIGGTRPVALGVTKRGLSIGDMGYFTNNPGSNYLQANGSILQGATYPTLGKILGRGLNGKYLGYYYGQSSAFGTYYSAMLYGNGLYAFSAVNNNYICKSTDGINFTNTSTITDGSTSAGNFNFIAFFINGYFFFIDSNKVIWQSANLSTWTKATSLSNNWYADGAGYINGGGSVAANSGSITGITRYYDGTNTNYYIKSFNSGTVGGGSLYSVTLTNGAQSVYGGNLIATDGTNYVVLNNRGSYYGGSSKDGGTTNMAYYTPGTSTANTYYTGINSTDLASVYYAKDRYFACGTCGNSAYSTNGTSWTTFSLPSPYNGTSGVYIRYIGYDSYTGLWFMLTDYGFFTTPDLVNYRLVGAYNLFPNGSSTTNAGILIYPGPTTGSIFLSNGVSTGSPQANGYLIQGLDTIVLPNTAATNSNYYIKTK